MGAGPAWLRRSGRQNGEIPVNFTKQISFYCVYLHQIHTTFYKITIKFCRRGDGGGAGLGGFANPRRLESCGPVPEHAGTSVEGKTEMDGASEMNRPSEEPAVTPTGCVMSRLSASGPHRSSLRRRLRPRENAATLLRGARACLALLAAAALLALAAPAQAQTEIWSATLTPGDLRLSILGCGNHIDSARCSSTTVLSEDSFNYDSTDYTITMLFVRSGRRFELQVDADITTNTNALTLVVGSTSLVLAEATTSTARLRTWDNSGVSMTAGTDIAVKLTAPNAATGAPSISGTATVGHLLTATAGTIADADGLPASFTYQWVRVDADGTSNEADITGANSSTYTLADDDEGKKIKVKVSFTDNGGNSEMRTSGAYPTSGTVQASSTPGSAALVSNVGQTTNGLTGLVQFDLAQSFTTGTNATGYTLTSIELRLNSIQSSDTPTVKLYRGSAIGTEVDTLSGPAMLDATGTNNYTFTPSSTVTLLMSTTYWVVAEANTGNARWLSTGTGEDATPATDWGIGDRRELRAASFTDGFSPEFGFVFQIRVNGTLGGIVISSDATLSALALEDASDDSAIAISPAFASGMTSYTASVDNDVDEITIKPTVNESSATVEYLNSFDTEITDADSVKTGQQVSLSVGANTIKVKVTAEDTTTMDTYTVVVTRAAAAANTAPTVDDVAVTSMPESDDTYGTGEMIQFTVTFDQAVTVTGTPEFEFCLGSSATVSCTAGMPPPALRSAAYVSGSGTTMLVFSYTVVAGDMDDNGIWIGNLADTLKLDAADTIEGTMGGLTAVLTHAEEGPQTGHKVNGNTAPGMPTDLAATANGQSRIDLSWTAPVSTGGSAITGYKIEVSPDDSSWSDRVADTQSTATTYAHMGLNPATTRYYRVSAINAVGTSDASDSDDATTEANTVTAQTKMVPADWALKPANIGAGEQFRLMFVSSTTRNATSTDIAAYNTFVSTRAAAGLTAIQTYANDFTALVSTESVNARTNTLTRATDTDAPIYWVSSGTVGADSRAADDYADFYDGTWPTSVSGYNESGSFVNLGAQFFWTGMNVDGTTHATEFMGASSLVRAWNVSGGNVGHTNRGSSTTQRIVALSPVFQVTATNIPATGAPTITGTAQVGETLTAGTTGIADANGLTSPTYTYQWIRVDGTEAAIAGEMASTYTLAAADEGKTIKVRVTFDDDAGNTETLTSAAYPSSGTVTTDATPPPPPPPNTPPVPPRRRRRRTPRRWWRSLR